MIGEEDYSHPRESRQECPPGLSHRSARPQLAEEVAWAHACHQTNLAEDAREDCRDAQQPHGRIETLRTGRRDRTWTIDFGIGLVVATGQRGNCKDFQLYLYQYNGTVDRLCHDFLSLGICFSRACNQTDF